MRGQLFTQYFLTDGIHTTDEWGYAGAEFTEFKNNLPPLYDSFKRRPNPNEAETEQDIIRPVLELLGWPDYLPQQGYERNEQVCAPSCSCLLRSRGRCPTQTSCLAVRSPPHQFLSRP